MQGTTAIVFGLLALPHVLAYQVTWTGTEWLSSSQVNPDNIRRHVYDASEWCPDEPIVMRFGDEVIVQSQRPWDPRYRPNNTCPYLIETDQPGSVGILLNVILEDTPTCEDQMIIVPSQSSPTFYCGPNKNVTGRADNFMNETITVTWIANSTSNADAKGIRILFTAFETVCKPGQTCFLCTNGRVIDEVHMCNGVNNCGDNSDEDACRPIVVPIMEPSLPGWVWAFMILGTLSCAVGCTVLGIYAGKLKSQRDVARQNLKKSDDTQNPLLEHQEEPESTGTGTPATQVSPLSTPHPSASATFGSK